MALDNYLSLQTAVKDWLARFDTTVSARVADFIRLGEERIWNRVRLSHGLSVPTVLTIPALANYVDLPADFLAFKRLATDNANGGGWQLDYMPADALASVYRGGQGIGDASRYSIEGGRLYYGSAGPASITAVYYQHPGYLDTVAATWLLARWPSIYLYAALLEASVFVKNTAKIAEFGSLLDKAIDAATDSDRAAQISGGALRAFRPDAVGRWR
jgi:hypothetical protein